MPDVFPSVRIRLKFCHPIVNNSLRKKFKNGARLDLALDSLFTEMTIHNKTIKSEAIGRRNEASSFSIIVDQVCGGVNVVASVFAPDCSGLFRTIHHCELTTLRQPFTGRKKYLLSSIKNR
ncbi:hypothetical protein OUZ56_008372 [Daphnia magna]|uniref:Uncharacterized protein n=1 Tax=Daphnia magna TaxID=35525 RepID=A0ABR0ACX6_9CRUS|nr:hypothetical protein OUZ56_008372 [Daphnia magna]